MIWTRFKKFDRVVLQLFDLNIILEAAHSHTDGYEHHFVRISS
jgi:hypothetical protein